MNKIIEDITEQLNEWTFPDVKMLTKPEKRNEESKEQRESQKIINELNELQGLKREYNEKISLLNNILHKLKEPLVILDTEIILLIKHIIKNATKKLIFKEIDLDEKIITHMIDELKALIHSEGGIITVYLSEVDYNMVNSNDLLEQVTLKINPNLTRGDLVIKSNTTEVRAILDERIEKIIGINK